MWRRRRNDEVSLTSSLVTIHIFPPSQKRLCQSCTLVKDTTCSPYTAFTFWFISQTPTLLATKKRMLVFRRNFVNISQNQMNNNRLPVVRYCWLTVNVYHMLLCNYLRNSWSNITMDQIKSQQKPQNRITKFTYNVISIASQSRIPLFHQAMNILAIDLLADIVRPRIRCPNKNTRTLQWIF